MKCCGKCHLKDMIFCKTASYKAIKKNITKILANLHCHSFDDEDMKRNSSFYEISGLHYQHVKFQAI